MLHRFFNLRRQLKLNVNSSIYRINTLLLNSVLKFCENSPFKHTLTYDSGLETLQSSNPKESEQSCAFLMQNRYSVSLLSSKTWKNNNSEKFQVQNNSKQYQGSTENSECVMLSGWMLDEIMLIPLMNTIFRTIYRGIIFLLDSLGWFSVNLTAVSIDISTSHAVRLVWFYLKWF